MGNELKSVIGDFGIQYDCEAWYTNLLYSLPVIDGVWSLFWYKTLSGNGTGNPLKPIPCPPVLHPSPGVVSMSAMDSSPFNINER